MRTLNIVSLIALGIFATSSFAQDNLPADSGSQWLSIPQIYNKLEAAGYRNVEKIERERGGYEIKATDRNGERVKLRLHPQTGEIIDQRQRSSKRDRYDGRDSSSGQRNSAECNERRCRDDLPQPGSAAAPTGK
ncbi:MAG: PepSY domain-containing protein [Nitrosomonadales bacterium]|nr:PepSY domain-containing protein [Nitrosomonadales bacterium]